MTRNDVQADPPPPWRLTSRAALLTDLAAIAVGVTVVVVAAVDQVASWQEDRILVSASTLNRLAVWLFLPAWGWAFLPFWAAGLMASIRARRRGSPDQARRAGMAPPPAPRWWKAGAAVSAVTMLTVLVVSMAHGHGYPKGQGRVLPGPVHQLSLLGVKDAAWTTVTPLEYSRWEADAMRSAASALIVFGGLLVMILSLVVLSRNGSASGRKRPDPVPGGGGPGPAAG